jgi:hypothetical protein
VLVDCKLVATRIVLCESSSCSVESVDFASKPMPRGPEQYRQRLVAERLTGASVKVRAFVLAQTAPSFKCSLIAFSRSLISYAHTKTN